MKFKAAGSGIYLGFSQEQQTHRSEQYHSCQNLLAKNSFPKSRLPGQQHTKLKAAHFWIYLGFYQKQKHTDLHNIILARICLPKIVFQNLGFLGSCIQNSKLHTFVLILAFLRNKNTQICAISFLPEFACQKCFSKIWASWAAVYKFQRCMLLYLSWLFSGTTNIQIHVISIFPGFAYQKQFSKIWAS
jgi:hypothetical protein